MGDLKLRWLIQAISLFSKGKKLGSASLPFVDKPIAANHLSRKWCSFHEWQITPDLKRKIDITLWETYKKLWKDPPFLICKSTIK